MAKPGPSASPASKRNSPDWAPCTLFMRCEQRRAVERYLALSKLTGSNGPQDQSEIVAAALSDWMTKHLPLMEQGGVRDLIGQGPA